jgi:hypothetical protein
LAAGSAANDRAGPQPGPLGRPYLTNQLASVASFGDKSTAKELVMSDLIVGTLGTPWITQATWFGESPREVAHRRRERDRERSRRRRHNAS